MFGNCGAIKAIKMSSDRGLGNFNSRFLSDGTLPSGVRFSVAFAPRSESNGFDIRVSSCVAFILQFIPNRCESTTVNDSLLVSLWVDPKYMVCWQ